MCRVKSVIIDKVEIWDRLIQSEYFLSILQDLAAACWSVDQVEMKLETEFVDKHNE